MALAFTNNNLITTKWTVKWNAKYYGGPSPNTRGIGISSVDPGTGSAMVLGPMQFSVGVRTNAHAIDSTYEYMSINAGCYYYNWNTETTAWEVKEWLNFNSGHVVLKTIPYVLKTDAATGWFEADCEASVWLTHEQFIFALDEDEDLNKGYYAPQMMLKGAPSRYEFNIFIASSITTGTAYSFSSLTDTIDTDPWNSGSDSQPTNYPTSAIGENLGPGVGSGFSGSVPWYTGYQSFLGACSFDIYAFSASIASSVETGYISIYRNDRPVALPGFATSSSTGDAYVKLESDPSTIKYSVKSCNSVYVSGSTDGYELSRAVLQLKYRMNQPPTTWVTDYDIRYPDGSIATDFINNATRETTSLVSTSASALSSIPISGNSCLSILMDWSEYGPECDPLDSRKWAALKILKYVSEHPDIYNDMVYDALLINVCALRVDLEGGVYYKYYNPPLGPKVITPTYYSWLGRTADSSIRQLHTDCILDSIYDSDTYASGKIGSTNLAIVSTAGITINKPIFTYQPYQGSLYYTYDTWELTGPTSGSSGVSGLPGITSSASGTWLLLAALFGQDIDQIRQFHKHDWYTHRYLNERNIPDPWIGWTDHLGTLHSSSYDDVVGQVAPIPSISYLYSAIDRAIDRMNESVAASGKNKVILAFTAGIDAGFSTIELSGIRNKLIDNNVVFNAIQLTYDNYYSTQGLETLTELTTATGGILIDIKNIDSLVFSDGIGFADTIVTTSIETSTINKVIKQFAGTYELVSPNESVPRMLGYVIGVTGTFESQTLLYSSITSAQVENSTYLNDKLVYSGNVNYYLLGSTNAFPVTGISSVVMNDRANISQFTPIYTGDGLYTVNDICALEPTTPTTGINIALLQAAQTGSTIVPTSLTFSPSGTSGMVITESLVDYGLPGKRGELLNRRYLEIKTTSNSENASAYFSIGPKLGASSYFTTGTGKCNWYWNIPTSGTITIDLLHPLAWPPPAAVEDQTYVQIANSFAANLASGSASANTYLPPWLSVGEDAELEIWVTVSGAVSGTTTVTSIQAINKDLVIARNQQLVGSTYYDGFNYWYNGIMGYTPADRARRSGLSTLGTSSGYDLNNCIALLDESNLFSSVSSLGTSACTGYYDPIQIVVVDNGDGTSSTTYYHILFNTTYPIDAWSSTELYLTENQVVSYDEKYYMCINPSVNATGVLPDSEDGEYYWELTTQAAHLPETGTAPLWINYSDNGKLYPATEYNMNQLGNPYFSMGIYGITAGLSAIQSAGTYLNTNRVMSLRLDKSDPNAELEDRADNKNYVPIDYIASNIDYIYDCTFNVKVYAVVNASTTVYALHNNLPLNIKIDDTNNTSTVSTSASRFTSHSPHMLI